MGTLIIIPARAGSKGLPGKNTRYFFDKPLIAHTIEFALSIKNSDDIICVTSNDNKVIEIANQYKSVRVISRPNELSLDSTGMNDVLCHAINFFNEISENLELTLLLQPTTPYRIKEDYIGIVKLFDDNIDMVVSVKESKGNPYFNLFEDNNNGYLVKCKSGDYNSRQLAPKVYEYNGSMYLINTKKMLINGLHGLNTIKKFIMPFERSIDIDDENDWMIAELIYKKNIS